MDYRASTQTNVKLKNQQIILKLLINKGSMTRAEIAKKMNSSKPTISKNVDDLLKENKLIEIGKDNNLVGKKGILLDINADYGHVLSIDLSKNKFRVVIANLKQEWLYYYKTSIKHYFFEEDNRYVNVLDILINFLDKHKVEVDKLRIVTIAFPGVVGHNDTVYLTNLKFREVLLNQLIPYIREELKIPFEVKNDINLATVAEKRYGVFSKSENLYLLSGDVGVGAGIIINHKLYEGDRNAAGEVGFVLPIQHRDGRYYTLEERVGIHALTKRFRIETGKNITIDELIKEIKSDNEIATKLYQDVLEDVAVTITNIASVLDIRVVIVDGRLFELKSTMLEDLNKRVELMTPFETIITKTSLDLMSLKGAVVVGVESVIKSLV